jgi:uncharacterized protein
MVLRNASTGTLLARKVRRARTPWHRIIGWLTRSAIGTQEGLLFEQCSAIHTIGMRAAIDVIFLDRNNCIKQVYAHVEPGRGVVGCKSATKVLEMGAGFVDEHDLLIGDCLLLESDQLES